LQIEPLLAAVPPDALGLTAPGTVVIGVFLDEFHRA